MSQPDMAERIVDFVRERDWVTFAELDRHIEGFHGEPGLALFVRAKPPYRRDRFLWLGMTTEGCDAIERVLDEHRIAAAPASVLAYLCDGGIPMTRKTRRTDPKWLPIALRPAAKANDTWDAWLLYNEKKGERRRRKESRK